MHIPDGFIGAGASIGAGVVSAGGVAVALRQAARTLSERLAPLAGLVAAFVFAVQMLNFPVAAGTSGHLIGGVLAAVLVGPWAAVLCLTVVLGVQALFADGGLTALGLNVLNMGLLTALPGYGLFFVLRSALGNGRTAVVAAAGVAATLSVVIAAAAFVAEYAIGGAGEVDIATVLKAMVAVHTLIGIGEGVITALTVGAVLSVRPDLVYGAPAAARPALEIRTAT
ncbi:MAG TPA: energy-coupling factor ABC transporter permease [Actinomycetota bacterium]|nr:energy-coupling factor ABC transporter permease [Actinomycetota bacterium]